MRNFYNTFDKFHKLNTIILWQCVKQRNQDYYGFIYQYDYDLD